MILVDFNLIQFTEKVVDQDGPKKAMRYVSSASFISEKEKVNKFLHTIVRERAARQQGWVEKPVEEHKSIDSKEHKIILNWRFQSYNTFSVWLHFLVTEVM